MLLSFDPNICLSDLSHGFRIFAFEEHLLNLPAILSWGLLLGCGLARFRSPKGKSIIAKNRFFSILVSTSMHLIWKLRNERFLQTFTIATNTEIHNRWASLMNSTLKRNQLLSSQVRFGSLAIKKQSVLNTWSGVLLDEDSLTDNWINSKGVLVGIRLAT
ncbi:hypothetical protein C8J57DRAFT_1048685 [Mycena rebaudengoi]|nr:hypothetical protein C8J57DRAFT_1048685 [Mycena rebaudengoi]